MGVHYVLPVDTTPSQATQDRRRARGLDPLTGRRPTGEPTVLAGLVMSLAMLAGIGVFLWVCFAVVRTALVF